MVHVAGEHERDLGAGRGDHLAEEVVGGVVDVGLLGRLHPGRVRRADDDAVAGLDLLGDLAEVRQLRVVEVGALLGVDGEQPPPLRQPQCEVAAGLGGLPPADVGALAPGEDPQEGGQAVVPVVVARQGVENGRRLAVGDGRKGGAVRTAEAVLVRLAARRRIDLVAAHDQRLAARQSQPADLERRLGQEIGDGVRGVEAVARVGDEIEPELLALAVVVELLGEGVLQLPLVEVRAELLGQRDPGTGRGQQHRGEPRHRRARGEAKFLGFHGLGARRHGSGISDTTHAGHGSP